MNRSVVICALALGLLFPIACRKQSQPAAPVKKSAGGNEKIVSQDLSKAQDKLLLRLGDLKFLKNVTLLRPAGPGQSPETTTFREREPITAMVDLKEAPPGVAVTAVFFDKNDSEMYRERKPVDPKTKSVSFQILDTRTWRPGSYHVQIWVGGDQEADVKFTIEPAKKKKK